MSKGKTNVYACQSCDRKIVTLDKDQGTTPFAIRCKEMGGCDDGMMYSSFYAVDQTLGPIHYVWFKPDNLDGYSDAMLEHIRKGGLDLRPATQEEMWRGARAGT